MANYVLQIDLVGAEKAEAFLEKLGGLSGNLKSGGGMASVLKDDSKALDAYWGKLQKVDKLANSIVSGKWKYSANKSPIKAMADDSERLQKALQNAGQPGKGLDKLGKSLLFGGWNYTPGKADKVDPLEAAKIAWRKAMAEQPPVVTIAQTHGSSSGSENPHQSEVDAFGRGGVAATGKLPKTQDEIDADAKAAMKKDEDAARRAEVAFDARRKSNMRLKREMEDRAKFYKDMTFLMMPLMNPGSVWATLFSTRQTFSALMTKHGQAGLGGMGLKGGIGGAALGTAGLVGLATVAGAALSMFTAAVQKAYTEMMASISFARALYGSALTNGLSTKFLANRQISADVMGVKEEDVMRMQQMQYVMQRLSYSIAIISGTAPTLAFTSEQFKIMEYNIRGMGASLAVANANTMNFVASIGSVTAKLLPFIYHSTTMGQLLDRVNGWLSKFSGTAPNPQSYMKQLPASHFEKMGLVIGGGASTTNAILTSSNRYLSIIAKNVAGTEKGKAINPKFGMSPNTANP